MKKYLGLFLLLVSFTSFGQFSNYTNINGRYKWIAGKFDSTFTIPSGTTPSLRVGGGTGPGALFYSTTDSTVYQYTGTRWTRLRGTDTAHVVSAYVRNTTASTMTAGQVVYINGSTGTTPTIALAVNTADSTSAMTFGFVRGTIAPNAFGWITTFGPLEGVNTNAYTEGEVIYLDSIPGQFTHDKPQAPYHMVTLGYIVKKSGGNGTIFAKIQNGYELEELHNVRITSPVRNNGILAYDSVAQLWKDTTLSAIGGVTGSGTSGQVAYWTGTSSQSGSNNLFWDNANGRLGIGTNAPATLFDIYSAANTNSFFQVGSSQNVRISINTVSANRFQLLTISRISDGATAALSLGVGTGPTSASSVISSNNDNLLIGSNVSNTFTETARFTSNQRLLIGQTTDSGQRLQVTGDVLFKGSGNTSGTTALTVQNSDGTNMLRVLNGGFVAFGNSADRPFIFPFTTGAGGVSLTGTNLSFYAYTSTQSATQGIFSFENTASAQTSGNNSFVRLSNTFSPTSGTATQSILFIQNTINQTGGANGITRGLYVNPTLTAAADWRSIEWSNNSGWGLYGAGTANNYIAGDIAIGTTTLGTATKFTLGGSETAASAIARGGLINTSLTASANNDVLVGLDIEPTFSIGGFTGVNRYGLRVIVPDALAAIYTQTPTANSYFNLIPSAQFLRATFASQGTVGFFYANPQNTVQGGFADPVSVGFGTGEAGVNTSIGTSRSSAGGGVNYYSSTNGSSHSHRFYHNRTEQMRLWNTGNLAIGDPAVDGGQRLQVTGQAIISSTSSRQLVVSYPGGAEMRLTASATANNFSILDVNGYGLTHGTSWSGINASQSNIRLWTQATNTTTLSLGGQDLNPTVARTRTIIEPVTSSSTLFSPTSGNAVDYQFRTIGNSRFSPTSGNATYTFMSIVPEYNTTGTYSGTVTGLIYNPTLTSMTGATHIAIQTASGDVLFGTTSGSVGVGTSTINASAILELSSTTKGFLPPRMTGTEAEAIASPAAGLLVYITNGNGTTITSVGWWGYDSSGWVKLN